MGGTSRHSHRFRGRSALIPENGHTYGRLLKQLTRPSQFGSILVALARSREIRTLRNLSCELSLWPLTFLNYTKMTKYEALEKNAVSEPEMPQPGDLHYSRNSRKPHFIGRFSAYSLMEKLGGRNEWRRGRDSNPRYRTDLLEANTAFTARVATRWRFSITKSRSIERLFAFMHKNQHLIWLRG